MKLKKLLKRMYKHKYGSGTTFYMKDNNYIDTRFLAEYRYEEEPKIHSLVLLELQTNKNGKEEVSKRYEMTSSRIMNKDIRFYLKDLVKPGEN